MELGGTCCTPQLSSCIATMGGFSFTRVATKVVWRLTVWCSCGYLHARSGGNGSERTMRCESDIVACAQGGDTLEFAYSAAMSDLGFESREKLMRHKCSLRTSGWAISMARFSRYGLKSWRVKRRSPRAIGVEMALERSAISSG